MANNLPLPPDGLSSLWATPFGERVLAFEQKQITQMLHRLYGRVGITMGKAISVCAPNTLSGCHFLLQSYQQDNEEAMNNDSQSIMARLSSSAGFCEKPTVRKDEASPAICKSIRLIADPAALPFQARSIDMIIANHVLDTHHEPEVVAREWNRVLGPEGLVVFSLFNPHSLLRLYPHINRSLAKGWRGLSASRVRDWLKLLGLTVEAACFGVYTPPSWENRAQSLQEVNRFELMGNRWWPTAGAVMVVLAKKRLYTPALVGMETATLPFQTRPAFGAISTNGPHATKGSLCCPCVFYD